MSAPASIPSHFPPLRESGAAPGAENAPLGTQSWSSGPSRDAVKAEKQRNRAARYRNKPGQRAKEAARLRAWRASRKLVNLSATSTPKTKST